MKRLFGTDGIRGVAGKTPLDRAGGLRFGEALARVLEADHGRRCRGDLALAVGTEMADALLVTAATIASRPHNRLRDRRTSAALAQHHIG